MLIPLRTGKYYFTIAIAMSRTHTVRVNTAMYSMMVSIPSLYSAFQRVRVQLHFRCTIRSGQPLSLVCFDGLVRLASGCDNFLFCPLCVLVGERSALDNVGFLLRHFVFLRKVISLFEL